MSTYHPLTDGFQWTHIRALDELIAETSKSDLVRLTTCLRRYISPLVTRDLFAKMQLDRLLQQHEMPIVTVLLLDFREFFHATQAGKGVFDGSLGWIAKTLENVINVSVQIAFDDRGTVGEFANDRLLIIFGFPASDGVRPIELTTSIVQAVRTATRIQQTVKNIRHNWELPDALGQFDIGIGLCAGGPALVGDIGGLWRRELTVISTAVNIAARAEELTRDKTLIASATDMKIIANQMIVEQVAELVSAEDLVTRDLGYVEVRGLDERIPLFHIGKLRLDALPPHPSVGPNDIGLSNWICDYIDGAMEREAALKVHQALSDVGRIATSVLEREAILQHIMQNVVEIFEVGTATLYLVDPLTKELVFECFISESGEPPERGERLPPGTGIAGWVVENKKELLSRDVHRDKRWYGEIGRDMHSMLCVPLSFRDRVVGAIQLMDQVPGKFTHADLEILMAFANTATIVIENAHNAQDQREIAEALTRSLDLTKVLSTIMDTLKRKLGARNATLYRIDPETKELIFQNVISQSDNPPEPGERLPPGTGIAGWVVENKKELLSRDIHEDKSWYGRIGADMHSMMCVPLLVQDPENEGTRVLGAIQVMDEEPGIYTREELNILKWLAASAAVALNNADQFQALQKAKHEASTRQRADS